MSHDPKIQPLHPGSRIVPGADGLRKVFVTNLVGECHLGIHRHERGRRQRVRVNLELSVVDTGPPASDEIGEVVCYEDAANGIRGLLSGPHTNLVETLAERIAALCLRDERVAAARVRVEKMDVFEDAESAGIEIERVRAPRL